MHAGRIARAHPPPILEWAETRTPPVSGELAAFAELLRLRTTSTEPTPVESARANRSDEQHDERPDSNDDSSSALTAPIAGFWAPLAAPAPSVTAPAPLSDLFSSLVARAALGGDARRGTLRLELVGRRDRGQVTVTAFGNEIEIEIGAIEGVDAIRLESRLAQRLAARGLRLVSFGMP